MNCVFWAVLDDITLKADQTKRDIYGSCVCGDVAAVENGCCPGLFFGFIKKRQVNKVKFLSHKLKQSHNCL